MWVSAGTECEPELQLHEPSELAPVACGEVHTQVLLVDELFYGELCAFIVRCGCTCTRAVSCVRTHREELPAVAREVTQWRDALFFKRGVSRH